MSGARESITAAEERLAPLERASLQAAWELATGYSDEHEQAAAAASIAYESALADPDLRATADAVLAAANGDSTLARQGRVLRLMCAAKERPPELIEQIVGLEARLAGCYSEHRGVVGGERRSDNELAEILLHSTDEELRREAWEATRSVGAVVADDLRRLATLRNEAAQRLGHRDHYALSLASEELDEPWLYGLLDSLDSDLAPSWEREKAAIDADQRERLGLPADAALYPWHYADRFFQEPPSPAVDPLTTAAERLPIIDAARRYFAALGHDVDPILARSDLYPRAGKDQHAFQISVDRGDDIRTLCNVVPTVRWLGTVLHELGHAVYDASLDRSLPWLLRSSAHTFCTEAIAMLHGRQARDAAFLETYAGVDRDTAAHPANGAVQRRSLHVLVPWVQVMARFERAFYADPDADLATTWWDLCERYQRLNRPPGERPHDWAAKIHLAVAPVYYHNYLLGEICASQLGATIARETGSASPAQHPQTAGALVTERFLRPGASLRWDELIERATGSPLGVGAFVADLA